MIEKRMFLKNILEKLTAGADHPLWPEYIGSLFETFIFVN